MGREPTPRKATLPGDALVTPGTTLYSELARLFTSWVSSPGEAANLASAIRESVDRIPTVTGFCTGSLERDPSIHFCYLTIIVKRKAPLLHDSNSVPGVPFDFSKICVNRNKCFAPLDRLRIICIHDGRLQNKERNQDDPKRIATNNSRY